MSTKSEYCVHIFDSIQNECDKRGEHSKECILLNDIFDKKCTKYNSDCINMREVLLQCCYNTKTNKSHINKDCILLSKIYYNEC
jgi:hypothetical protein